MSDLERPLELLHQKLQRIVPWSLESLDIVHKVNAHRDYWRPAKVKTLLLAESHVFTTPEEVTLKLSYPASFPESLPSDYVRLVYCLGYGESDLIPEPFPPGSKNSGTWQYWNLFHHCIHPPEIPANEVQVTKTRSLQTRLINKLNLLKKLKERGIWLLDLSPIALAGGSCTKDDPVIRNTVYAACFNEYAKPIIQQTEPEQIICIGSLIKNLLSRELEQLAPKTYYTKQPNAYLRRYEIEHFNRLYYEVCRQ